MGSRWKGVQQMRTLGHHLSSSGSIGAYYQPNIGRLAFRKSGVNLKLRRLKCLVFPITNFRLTRWPYSHSRVTRLDRVQREMVARCLNEQKDVGESLDSFVRRKNRLVYPA